MVDPQELESLMSAARMRIAHLWCLVAMVIVLISSQISLSPMTLERIANITVWALGCIVVLSLGGLWYRARSAATRRLVAVLRSGAPSIRVVEVTSVLFEHFVPFGWEVDAELVTGERLAFGFWQKDTAMDLVQLIESVRVAERPNQLISGLL